MIIKPILVLLQNKDIMMDASASLLSEQQKPTDLDSALLLAIYDNNIEEAMKLVPTLKDEDLQIANLHGYTAFMCAAMGGHISLVVALFNRLGRGALKIKDNHGCTALMLAAAVGKVKMIPVLYSFYLNDEAARLSALNILDHSYLTPLMHAALNGHLEMVKLLIVAGAEVNFANRHGYTARTFALSWKRDEVAAYLQSAELEKRAQLCVEETKRALAVEISTEQLAQPLSLPSPPTIAFLFPHAFLFPLPTLSSFIQKAVRGRTKNCTQKY